MSDLEAELLAVLQRHVGNDGETPETPGIFIDWSTFWTKDGPEAEWLYEPILARGRGHAIYAAHKTGKSLLVLFVAALIAVTTDTICVYFDFEMTEDDVYERLEEMGYGPETDLSRFYYAVLPPLAPLDTQAGADAFLAILDEVAGKHPGKHLATFIDTFGRAVAGEENLNDTVREFYRLTGMRLKQRGFTWVRTDHSGKDAEKGQRGGSAKGDDVDVIWKLAATDDGFKMTSIARMAWVPKVVGLLRREEPLRYVVTDGIGVPEGTAEVEKWLEELKVPIDWSVRKARAALAAAGRQKRTAVVSAAIKSRRERLLDVESVSRKHFPALPSETLRETPNGNTHLAGAETPWETPETPF